MLHTFVYQFLCRHLFSFLSAVYLAGELLGHMITLCLTFKEMSDCFHDPDSPEGVRQFVIFLMTICGYGFWERIPELKCLLVTSYWEDIIPTWHDWVIGDVDLHRWFKVPFPSFSSAQYLLSVHLLHSRLTPQGRIKHVLHKGSLLPELRRDRTWTVQRLVLQPH